MTLANATVLYQHFLDKEMSAKAANLLLRYPELEVKPKEVKKIGNNSSNRKKG